MIDELVCTLEKLHALVWLFEEQYTCNELDKIGPIVAENPRAFVAIYSMISELVEEARDIAGKMEKGA